LHLWEAGPFEIDHPEADPSLGNGNGSQPEIAERQAPDSGKDLGMSIADVMNQEGISREERKSQGISLSSLIVVALVLMAVALLYVWSHVNMTKLEYKVAEEMGIRERLLEEQKKLKVEVATLKAPQRIEVIGRNKLQMTYPERDQVILLK
jgi:cell division protein FtsL